MNVNKRTIQICFMGIMAALMAIGAWISIPTPWGVNFTMQTLMIALGAYLLGPIYGTISVVVYLLLGCIGLPVFTNFNSGFGALSGATGGYLWGFIPMAFFCGLGTLKWDRPVTLQLDPEEEAKQKKKTLIIRYGLLIVLSLVGLACCHIPGVIQLGKVAGFGYKKAFLLGSASYLAKDIVSMVIAYFVAVAVKKALRW